MRFADPKPGYCSVCFQGNDPEKRYVDFEVAFDGAPVLDRETLTIAVLPWDGSQPSHDDLYVCEACLRSALELLELKPELHARQVREIRRMELERDHWRDTAKRAQGELDKQIEANMAASTSTPRRRKVAV